MGSSSDQIKGKAKEAVGTVTGNKDLETEGKADRRGGEAKEKVEDATDKIKDTTGDAIDKVKDALPHK